MKLLFSDVQVYVYIVVFVVQRSVCTVAAPVVAGVVVEMCVCATGLVSVVLCFIYQLPELFICFFHVFSKVDCLLSLKDVNSLSLHTE